jgi:hypothetical protein
MPRDKRIDAVIAEELPVREEAYQPTGPDPRPTKIRLAPAFYRIHYQNTAGRVHVTYRLADSDKHATDLVSLKLGSVVRLTRYANRQELFDSLPPGRSLRSVLPPADLKLAFSLDLIPKTDLT